MAQRIYTKEVKSNLMANVEEEKKKLDLNLHHEERFDDLIQNIQALSLQVQSSRDSEAAEAPRVQDEREKMMVRSIEEYLTEEERMEDLKARDEKISSENEELKETLGEMRTEEKELKEKVASRVKELEDRKKGIQAREARARETRIQLEEEITEKELRLKTLSKEKSDLAEKLTRTEASAVRASQELTNLSALKDRDFQKVKAEEEKERSLKEKIQQLVEKKNLLEENIKQLVAGGAERRGEVERERDLLQEKLRKTQEETKHLELEEASLAMVEQQVNTLQQEKANLQARFRLLEEKNSTYIEETAGTQRMLEAAEVITCTNMLWIGTGSYQPSTNHLLKKKCKHSFGSRFRNAMCKDGERRSNLFL